MWIEHKLPYEYSLDIWESVRESPIYRLYHPTGYWELVWPQSDGTLGRRESTDIPEDVLEECWNILSAYEMEMGVC